MRWWLLRVRLVLLLWLRQWGWLLILERDGVDAGLWRHVLHVCWGWCGVGADVGGGGGGGLNGLHH